VAVHDKQDADLQDEETQGELLAFLGRNSVI
jgi:hypothetical protein